MQKYSSFFQNIAKLIETGIVSSKDLKNEFENILKFRIESLVRKMNLVTREEFEVQKKIIEKLQKKDRKFKKKKKTNKAKKS